MTEFAKVGEFHRKFDLPCVGEDVADVWGPPVVIDTAAFMFRLQFLHEELNELLAGYRQGDLEKVADSLADLVYVAHGTAHMFRVPLDRVFDEVHKANMNKVRASGTNDRRSKRKHHLDVVKPDGWTPPDIGRILREAGYGA